MSSDLKWKTSFPKNNFYYLIIIIMLVTMTESCSEEGKVFTGLRWEELPPMPPLAGREVQPGLAGPLAGISNHCLLVAGGANFEGEMPWRGGAKSYHNEIYLLQENEKGELEWKIAEERLPCPMAYAAMLSIEEGILSIGGETAEGPVKDVILLTVDQGRVMIRNYPSLPLAITSPSATQVDGEVYLAGGQNASGAVDLFLTLDLHDMQKGWQILPSLPVPLSHGVAVAQSDGNETCIYFLGGRNKTTDVHSFFSEIYKYIPSTAVWTREGHILKDGKPLPLSAGTGIAAGVNQILLMGGDPGIYFNQTERLNNAIAEAGDFLRDSLLRVKDFLLSNHPGFNREVMAYHTTQKKWTVIGNSPEGLPATTAAFFWNDLVVIPGGEVRPGVRTPRITAFRLQ